MIKAVNIAKPEETIPFIACGFDRIDEMVRTGQARTPFLILSRQAVRRSLEALEAALPGVKIHYAVKANSHAVILEEVAGCGHSFDIASYQELQLAVEAGGRVGEFIHSHPIKSPDEIDMAIKAGAPLFVVDNPAEVEKFIPFAGKVGLMIRFKVDNSSAVVNLSYKFGCQPEEILPLARKIRECGLDYRGLAFHVGSQCLENGIYIDAVRIASEAIGQLKEDGFETGLLDIGGGFPVPYTEAVPDIYTFCEPIRQALKQFIPSEISLACEPGRYISATAVTLVTTVIGKSVRAGKPWYFMDDGLYGSFSGRLFDHCKYQVLTNRNTTWKRAVLAGPTCDSFDVIYRDIVLPPLEIGDYLMFPAMGAYCSVSASTFNCLRKAEYVVID